MHTIQWQPSPLPPLGNEDAALARTSSFESAAVLEGGVPVPTSRLFEAKAVNLLPRPKSSLGMSRSSPAFPSAPSSSLAPGGNQPAPRHDEEIAIHCSTAEHVVRRSGGGEPSCRRPQTVLVSRRWSAGKDGPTKLASGPALLHPEEETIGPTDNNRVWGSSSSSCRVERSRVESFGNLHNRAQTTSVLRRTSSDVSGGSIASVGSLSVTTSNDPGVLKGEIRRLQGALMNEFKGGNRFVGGAQFKASARKQTSNCGGCLQVREALRRARAETRELRGSLFRAEAAINHLSLTKGGRRARELTRATTPTGNEVLRDAYTLAFDPGGPAIHGSTTSSTELEESAKPSREGLLARVRKLERELRLADFRHSQTMGAAVSADHGLSDALAELEKIKNGGDPSDRASKRERDEPQPCKKCSELEERLSGEATKANRLMRRIRDHQQESKRLRGDLAKIEHERTDAREMQQKIESLTKLAEGHHRANDVLESEKTTAGADIERLTRELESRRMQALHHDGQIQTLSEQHGASQCEVSVATHRLEEAEEALATLRAALKSERLLREQKERNVGALTRQIAEEQAGSGGLKEEVTTAKEGRRRSESQAAAAEVAHRRALKAALTSCVRLCVVAPTVNINLDDRSRSFCSGLPEEKIRTFVEDSVLPRFTRVLLQPGTGDSPPGPWLRDKASAVKEEAVGGGGVRGSSQVSDGQADFDAWLRDLLVDMQTSIERHVAGVFQTQTAASTLSTRR